MKRLLIDIPLDLHFEIKKRALFHYVSIRQYVIDAILDRIKKEKKQNEGN